MHTFSILRKDVNKAQTMERVEKLHTYRSHKVNPWHNFVQHYIKYLETMHLEMRHLGQPICEVESMCHLMRTLPKHWHDRAIEIRDNSSRPAYSYPIRILMKKWNKENENFIINLSTHLVQIVELYLCNFLCFVVV